MDVDCRCAAIKSACRIQQVRQPWVSVSGSCICGMRSEAIWPWAAGTSCLVLPPSPPLPKSLPCSKAQPLGLCFFRLDGLRFDWSSSDRFGGHAWCRGWLLFSLLLTDTWGVSQGFCRFTGITVHLLGFASYLFALLLFREEPLRGLKNLCSLFCQHLGPNVWWLSPLPTALFFMSCSAFSAAWA